MEGKTRPYFHCLKNCSVEDRKGNSRTRDINQNLFEKPDYSVFKIIKDENLPCDLCHKKDICTNTECNSFLSWVNEPEIFNYRDLITLSNVAIQSGFTVKSLKKIIDECVVFNKKHKSVFFIRKSDIKHIKKTMRKKMEDN